MVKVFRKNRQKSLLQSKAIMYFFYAVGEIALVMIGILLALQVNNWNQARQERKKEMVYLRGLKSDIMKNVEEYDRFLGVVDTKLRVLRAILSKEYDTLEVTTDTNLDILDSRLSGGPPVRKNTVQEMLSTGGISLLSSPPLKEEIFNYYNLVDERLVAMKNTFGDWPSIVSEMMPGNYAEIDASREYNRVLGREAEKQFIKQLKDDLERIRPSVNAEIQYALKLGRSLIWLKTSALELVNLLAEELKQDLNN